MFKHAQKPGLILAFVGIVWTLIFYFAGFGLEEWPGLLFLLVMVGFLIFFGAKVRDGILEGKMSFAQAFRWSFSTLFISTIVSSIFNYFYFKDINTEFIPAKFDEQLEKMSETMTEGQIDGALSSMEPFFSPIFFVVSGLVVMLLISLVLSLISGAILKKD